jgi:DNA-binding CsgD family transcriptional regulator
LFVRASALPGRPDLDQPNPLPWRAGAALAAARLGDRDRAAELAGEELARARSVGARRPLGVALRVTGLVTAGPRGLDLLHEAVAVLERSPALLERARALTDLGARLRDAGQDGAAREPLRRGLELAERCGAGAVVARAGEHLRLAGGRRQRRRSAEAETAVDVLTSAERRVVRFAALGVSTPEIAHNLYLSPKTVEWHLANVYRKLGVRSRSELAGIVGDSAA